MFLYLPSCIFYNKYISYIYSIHIKTVSPVGFFPLATLKFGSGKNIIPGAILKGHDHHGQGLQPTNPPVFHVPSMKKKTLVG